MRRFLDSELSCVFLLLGGCFAEPLVAGEATDAAQGTDADEAGSATDGASSAATVSVDGADATTEPADTTEPDETGSDTASSACGLLGEDCCAEGCTEGACHRGRCVAFAGGYAEAATCGGCIETPNGDDGRIPPSTLPFLGACACPTGFDVSPGLPTTSDYCPQPEVLHTPTDLFFCQVDALVAASDWTGAYVTSIADACLVGAMDSCVVANPYTRSCACPGGEEEVVAQTWTPCGGAGEPDDLVEIHVCVRLDVPPINFGGAYQTRWVSGAPPVCEAGNPRAAGECECPPGFTPEGLRITSPINVNGGDLFVCVQY